jgi:hypothetical protein
VVPRGNVEQLLQGGRRVEDRRAITAQHLAIDALEVWLEFQLGLPAETDCDEVQAGCGYLDGQPLHGFAVATCEQRRLSSRL